MNPGWTHAWLQPGRHVVCRRVGTWIDHYFLQCCLGNQLPVIGMVYTVRKALVIEGTVTIHLCEIVNPVFDYRDGTGEIAFAARLFAPVKYSRFKWSEYLPAPLAPTATEFV